MLAPRADFQVSVHPSQPFSTQLRIEIRGQPSPQRKVIEYSLHGLSRPNVRAKILRPRLSLELTVPMLQASAKAMSS